MVDNIPQLQDIDDFPSSYYGEYHIGYAITEELVVNVVLHICCGVCAAGVMETLAVEGHEIVGYFYNPNIHPQAEYQRRLDAVWTVAKRCGFSLEEGPYDPDVWVGETLLLQGEPECGQRCGVCFRIRLHKTQLCMLSLGADAFTTTLTVSHHKSARVVNQIGQDVGAGRFLVRDFKKNDGFKRAMQLAKEWDIYRQNYCGCVYSMR